MLVVLDALNNRDPFLKKSIGLFEKFISHAPDEEHLTCQAILSAQHASRSAAKNVNSIEKNEIRELLTAVKSLIKLTLPKIKGKLSLHVKLDNSYYTESKYCQWEAAGFRPDPFFFKGCKVHKLKRLSFFKKKQAKSRRLKVKLLLDDAVPRFEDTDDLSELLALKGDILIFVTGGGFVSDFEKIAQFYLIEIAKELSLPVFIVKYR